MKTALRDALYLAGRSLRARPWGTTVLVLGTAVAIFLPIFTAQAASLLEDTLLARANASPILIGTKGDDFDLTMSALYFRGRPAEPVPAALLDRLAHYGLALPIHVAATVSTTPLVGTGVEYFEARDLELQDGRLPLRLGEVVAGAETARRFNLQIDDRVRSDLSNLYNLAGAYPTVLEVVGILEPTGNADDEVFFTSLESTWLLDGRLHGHEAVMEEAPSEADSPNDAELAEDNVDASTAIFLFTEITEANRATFHMHGGDDDAPAGAILVWPKDRKAHDQLLGDFALDETYQAVRPVEVVRAVLGIVLQVRDGLSLYFGLVVASTVAFFILVMMLSLRIRRSEIELMRRLGSGRFRIATLVGTEVALVLIGATVVALSASVGALALLRTVLGL